MAFEDNLPADANVLVQQSKTDVQRELDKVDNPNRANAFLDSSWLGALPTANANRIFDYYLQLAEAIRLNMPDTAEDEFADRWGSIYVGSRTASEGSTGNVVATGTATSVIGIGEGYQSTEGIAYITTAASTITAQSISVATITAVGTIATATTAVAHGIASNVPVTISGANEAEYNGTFAIQVTGANTFTYTLPSVPAGSATGTLLADFTSASVPIEAVPPSNPDDPFGAATNQTLDTPLTLQSTIAGVDSVANVDFGELAGGADEESTDDYQVRYLDKIQNPVSHFATPDIDQKIRADVPGVTRTFIQKSGQAVGESSITSITRFDVFAKVVTTAPHGLFTGALITVTGAIEGAYNVTDEPCLVIDSTTFAYIVAGSPSSPATGTIIVNGVIPLGRVQTYFTRDNDPDPIPTAPEIADVKDAILEITPANTPDSFVLVDAPVALPIDFTFTELAPTLPSLQDAVTANLQQFFNESVSVGVDIDEDAYRSAIFNTVDPASGQSVTSFALSTPSGDIAVGVGELPTLGTVIYP
jgi:uncharacterized phage protein gp47/JayE